MNAARRGGNEARRTGNAASQALRVTFPSYRMTFTAGNEPRSLLREARKTGNAPRNAAQELKRCHKDASSLRGLSSGPDSPPPSRRPVSQRELGKGEHMLHIVFIATPLPLKAQGRAPSRGIRLQEDVRPRAGREERRSRPFWGHQARHVRDGPSLLPRGFARGTGSRFIDN